MATSTTNLDLLEELSEYLSKLQSNHIKEYAKGSRYIELVEGWVRRYKRKLEN